MKILFFVMVIGSLCYLAYQESPQVAQWIDAAPIASIPSRENVGEEYKKRINDVKEKLNNASQVQIEALQMELRVSKSKQAELMRQLSEKDTVIMQQKELLAQQGGGGVDYQPLVTESISTAIEKTPDNLPNANVQRRESLMQLAERMELHALGFVDE